MSAESILYGILSTAAGVTALVGDRIYPDLIPEEKATPYIGYESAGATDQARTLEGTLLAERTAIAIACWAETRLVAEQIADAVRVAMIGSGWRADGRGAEIDPTTGRLAATLTYSVNLAL